ncbi:MAG: hypothetical protein EXR71_16290 [Myxococcales bacterium]|nr:hypothetical protein [Myxococcales bacterium]
MRAYLVCARGGAPLLSSADARQLRDWLDRGVRVGAIVRAIDRVSQDRLARRVRTPLSLRSCRAEVEKQQKHAGAWVRAGGTSRVRSTSGESHFAEVDELSRRAEADIASLSAGDSERRALDACARAVRFFEEAWERGPREQWLAEADRDLADARVLYDEAEWEQMRECFARDRLRQRYPTLTATHIWQESARGVD